MLIRVRLPSGNDAVYDVDDPSTSPEEARRYSPQVAVRLQITGHWWTTGLRKRVNSVAAGDLERLELEPS